MAPKRATDGALGSIEDVLQHVASLQRQIHAKAKADAAPTKTYKPVYHMPMPRKWGWELWVGGALVGLWVLWTSNDNPAPVLDQPSSPGVETTDEPPPAVEEAPAQKEEIKTQSPYLLSGEWKFRHDIENYYQDLKPVKAASFSDGRLELRPTPSECGIGRPIRKCHMLVAIHRGSAEPHPLPSIQEVNELVTDGNDTEYPRIEGYVPYRQAGDLIGYELKVIWQGVLASRVYDYYNIYGTEADKKITDFVKKNSKTPILECHYANADGNSYNYSLHWFKDYPAQGNLESMKALGNKNPFIKFGSPVLACPNRRPV